MVKHAGAITDRLGRLERDPWPIMPSSMVKDGLRPTEFDSM